MTREIYNIVVIAFLFASCNNTGNPVATSAKQPVVLHFELDSAKEIANSDVREQLASIALELEKNADRIMVVGYSENTGNEESNRNIAHDYAWAVKQFMRSKGARDYNVGVEIKGFQNPILPNNPADLGNRRVELIYLNQ